MQIDPMAEWRQIFNDCWRYERDYFYDPAMNGVDGTRCASVMGNCSTTP